MAIGTCNILFTSAGRRVALVRLFRQALERAGVKGELVTSDLRPDAPARFAADRHVLAPRVTEPSYIEHLLDTCRHHDIHLVVPLIDTELHVLAPHVETFRSHGVILLVSSPETTALSLDKRTTHAFFAEHAVPTPALLARDELAADPVLFPVLLKPGQGSASVGVKVVQDLQDLDYSVARTPDPVVQELLRGDEYTIDVLVDRSGGARCVVPRRRIETRAGEVSKGITVKDAALIEAGRRVIELLPGAFGPITLQCFREPSSRIAFIEINPRFGGGFPLSAAAGADFPTWLVDWTLGRDPDIPIDGWQDGLAMLRFDDAYFVPRDMIDAPPAGV